MAVPGWARVCEAGLNCAVTLWVDGIVRSAVAAFWTAGLLLDVAAAVRFRVPGKAKSTAPVVIGTTCDAPGASVTLVAPRLATSAAGPARARLKVSVVVPVLVTVAWKLLPGAPSRD